MKTTVLFASPILPTVVAAASARNPSKKNTLRGRQKTFGHTGRSAPTSAHVNWNAIDLPHIDPEKITKVFLR